MRRSTVNLFSHLEHPHTAAHAGEKNADRDPDVDIGELPLTSGYWLTAQRPLQSLMFLLPLVFLYELGALQFTTDVQAGQTEHIVARNMLQDLMLWLGVGIPSIYLPGGLLVVVLLVWHWLRDDPWRVDFGACGLMLSEAILLSLPLLILGLLIHRFTEDPVAQAMQTEAANWQPLWKQEIVLSVGAGLYEEMLFRMLGIGVINAILIQIFAMKKDPAAITSIFICAAAFGLYHFTGLENVRWWPFFFYTVAGVYFGYIFMLRGFGIVVAVHALYDIWVVVQKHGLISG